MHVVFWERYKIYKKVPSPLPLNISAKQKQELNEIYSLIHETSKPEKRKMAIGEKIACKKS